MRKHILRLSTRLSFTVLLLGLLCTFSFAHGNAQIRTSTDKAAQIANSTAYDYVNYATTNGFMNTTLDTQAALDKMMTRAQFVECLYRLDGEPPMESLHKFSDVESTSAYSSAISWAATYGITVGTSASTFSPNELITKDQATLMLYRLADHHNYKTTNSEGNEVAVAQKWATSYSITTPQTEYITQATAAEMLSIYDQTYFDVDVDQYQMTLLYPSTPQLTICRGRDFYVVGDFADNLEIPNDAKLQITVTSKKTGKTVRTIYTNIKNNYQGMNVNYAGLNVEDGDREAYRYSMMPDLVYDPQKPASFKYTWNKACYSDEHFTCVVYGGEYNHDVWHFDQYDKWIGALPEGDYTLAVTLNDDGEQLAWYKTQITIGSTSDKVLSRFSPEYHMENVSLYSNWKGYTLLLDPFPGYWNMPMFFPEWENNQFVGQIRQRWALADRQEYKTGRIHIFNYNITETSTSYSVEIGQLAYDKVLNNPSRVQYCFYDTGNVYGNFVETDPDLDYPVYFTRIDHDALNTSDNVVDLRVSDIINDATNHPEPGTTVQGSCGETVYFNGACYVLQPPKTQLLTDTESFSMNNANSVSYLYYEILKDGVDYSRDWREVSGLSRITEDGNTTKAILEFRHGFKFDEPGTYTIRVNPVNSEDLEFSEALESRTFFVVVR